MTDMVSSKKDVNQLEESLNSVKELQEACKVFDDKNPPKKAPENEIFN